ncbi:MAG TPA: SUMF1/EgtB/PvdO family nonheme iron enzyme [Kofleriaceae bacterium]|jgi:formylglycine-generating enzyme required for sulfatase activity|nr:SUMF1/EgtB/PvdO family nonheme iron enzyme [Kofleriaceae bacterium]
MFLKHAIPDSGQEIARYRAWIEPAFNAADFGRLYSDLFGPPIALVVHDRMPLTELIHETLVDCARRGRPLVQLLARAVRARASRPQLVGPLAQALGLAPLVEVADLLVHHGCPDALRDEVSHAFAETTGARLVSDHRDGRAAWIDVLIGLEELPVLAGRRAAVIEFLERISDAWQRTAPGAAPALARWLDQQRIPPGIAAEISTGWLPSTATTDPAASSTGRLPSMATTDPAAAWLALGLERHGRVKIVGFREAEISLPLDRVFVPLYMYADRRRRGAGPDRHPDRDELDDGGADISFDDAIARSGDDRPCLALVGDPGAGKTTLLRYLFRRVARGEVTGPVAHLRGLHPVLVRLANVRDDEQVPRGLRAIVARIAAEDGHPEAGPALLARRGQRLLFLLDGLDEVRNEPARERLCAWLNDEIDQWPGCGFIATSRLAAWARTPALSARFLPVWVQGMRGTVRDDYVRRWFGAVVRHFHGAVDSPAELEARASAQASALLQVLASGDWRSHPRLLEMVANPLMLSTLCLAHYYDTRLPEQRGELYERTLGLLIDVWTRQRKDGQVLRLETARLVLQPLAYAMHEQDRHELAVEEAVELVRAPLARVPALRAVAPTAERFLALVRDECGVLTSRDLGRVEFVHLSFQEYLAACHVAGHELGAALADRAGDPRWEEVILLAMSRPGVFRPFMSRALERGDVDAALLRQCLREALEIRGEPFEVAADRALARLRAPACPPAQAAAAAAELRRLFELVAGYELPGMIERARSVVDAQDRALRDAARKLVGLENASATEAREGQPFVEPVTQMTFVWVPGGSFLMGASKTLGEPGYDPDAYDDEMPAHLVQLTGFWMGVYPVTNEQYARFMAETGQPAPPSFSDRRFNDPAQPVVTVSWENAVAFTRWLTVKLAGIEARLPTEAEREYAARGTDGGRYPWGNERPDRSRATFGLPGHSGRPAVVGHTPGGVSPFGVHDLAGNVWEWCLDTWADYAEISGSIDPCHQGDTRGEPRVVRGGSWHNFHRTWSLRSAFRFGLPLRSQLVNLGFRVVCEGARQPDAL